VYSIALERIIASDVMRQVLFLLDTNVSANRFGAQILSISTS
jgi:hypothetical protein